MADNDLKLERFGRYLILDHLVDGGMAKISRARFLGEQADKIVAIKTVQQQFSQDESFRAMFEGEIKVTFGLIHPNIAQTYDYGLMNEQLYTAMEYVDGKNLKEYLDKLKERNFVFPVEISVYIITQVCQGLHYAHTFIDKLTGKKANIIHRDISPHNIMITYDGAVKVIDFGIAKAETNAADATQAGTIKGKLSYLAPEYLDGHRLDSRYDQFALGITIWEMLCSRKLFKASNELAILKEIQACNIPAPSTVNPNVPKELDDIVLKTLSKSRDDRFETLDKLNRALVKFLYANYSEFNPTDLAYFAKELFKDDIKKDREKLFQFGQIDLKPYLDDLQREQDQGKSAGSITGSNGLSSSTSGAKTKRQPIHMIDFGFEDADKKIKLSGEKPPVIGADTAKKKKTVANKISSGQTKTDHKALKRAGNVEQTQMRTEVLDADNIEGSKTSIIIDTKSSLETKKKKLGTGGTTTSIGVKKKKKKTGTGTTTSSGIKKKKKKTITDISVLPAQKKSSSFKMMFRAVIAASLLIVAGGGYFVFVEKPETSAISKILRTMIGFQIDSTVVAENVKVEKNDQSVENNPVAEEEVAKVDVTSEDIEGDKRDPSSISKNVGESVSNGGEQNGTSDKMAKIVLTNYKKYKHKIFIDGEQKDVFVLGEIKVPAEKEFTLRVETKNRKHFVQKISLAGGDLMEVEIPQTAVESFGYLMTSRDCVTGTLSFELYGEKRSESLPIKTAKGIQLPASGDSGTTGEYELSYKKLGSDIFHKAKVKIKHEDDLVDFCENI